MAVSINTLNLLAQTCATMASLVKDLQAEAKAPATPAKPAQPALTAEQKAKVRGYMEFGGLSQADAIKKVLASSGKSAAAGKPATAGKPTKPAAAPAGGVGTTPGDYAAPGKGRPSVAVNTDEEFICCRGHALHAADGKWQLGKFIGNLDAENVDALTEGALKALMDKTASAGFAPALGAKARAMLLEKVAEKKAEIAEQIAAQATAADDGFVEEDGSDLDDDDAALAGFDLSEDGDEADFS